VVSPYRRRRRTLAGPTEKLDGIGLHSGIATWVRILPAAPETGLVFVDSRVSEGRPSDFGTGQEVPALAANVFDTTRCTQLRCGDKIVQTVEHVLSALAGLGVDDARLEIDGVELPAADGSALPFVELIQSVGIVEHGGEIDPFVVTDPIELSDGRGGLVRLEPASEPSYSVTLEYPKHSYIGTQSASGAATSYATEIAPARTFGFLTEIDYLRSHGLALGASYDNALVLGEEGYANERRFDNEMARHKILDMIGDLALFGRPIIASITAVKPGHQLNTQMAAKLTELSASAPT